MGSTRVEDVSGPPALGRVVLTTPCTRDRRAHRGPGTVGSSPYTLGPVPVGGRLSYLTVPEVRGEPTSTSGPGPDVEVPEPSVPHPSQSCLLTSQSFVNTVDGTGSGTLPYSVIPADGSPQARTPQSVRLGIQCLWTVLRKGQS